MAEKSSDGSIHYVTKLSDAYKVSGDAFYTQNEKSVLPLGTLTVEETKASDGYLLDGAYMQAGDSTEPVSYTHLWITILLNVTMFFIHRERNIW